MKHVRRLILAALILLLVCALPEAYASIEEYVVEATLGQSVTASPLDWLSNSAFFKFTAPEEGLYMFSLTKGAQGNTYYLDQCDEDGGRISGSLSSTSDSDTAFRWVFCADADTVYYFRTYNYSGEVPAFYELTVSASSSDLFEARAKQETVYTDYGEPAVLKVFASAPAGTEVTYQWYRVENGGSTQLEGETGNTYSIASVQQNETYRCTVTCSNGSTEYVYLYSKIDTHFSMEEASDRWPTAAPGEAVTLRVSASVTYGGITYEWRDYSGTIPDQTASSYTVTPTAENREFICTATDANGTREEVRFYVSIDNELFVRAAGNADYFSILPGETAALRVIAGCRVGDVHYQWNKYTECTYGMYGVSYDNQQEIEGATADTLTVTEPGYYWCTVTDDYGSERSQYFSVWIDNGFVTWIENEEDDSGRIPVEYDGSLTMKVGAACNSGTITYRWFYENPDTYTGELIEGAATSSYHVDHVTRNERYSCLMIDQYGNSNAEFFNLDVGLEGTLMVQYASDSHFTMGLNDTYTMAVRAYSLVENATISYQWYYQDGEYDLHLVESDGNGPSYTIDVNSVGYEFYCEVSDSNDNRTAKWFYPTLDTPLTASQNSEGARVLYGESAELSVEAETDYGPLTYQWYVESPATQWEKVPIEGATAASYTVTPTQVNEDYYCEIKDRYRKISRVFFVSLSEPQLSAKGGQFVSFQEGDEVTLQVEVAGAMGNLSYRWSLPEEDRELEGETTDTLVVTPPAGMTVYRCVLRDDAFGPYAESSTLDFVCTSAAWPELSLGETVTIESPGKTLRYTFTPTVGGMYHVELSGNTMYSVSEGGKVYLEWNNPEKSCFRLDAGKQYAFTICDRGSFRMTKTSDSETLSAVLLTGQKVVIPFIDHDTTANLPTSYVIFAETASSDQPSVIRVSNIGSDGEKAITALSAGSATVTVQFENGFIRYYQITVYSGADVVKTPPAVRTISEETFAGDTSVQFADLSNVKYIGSGAFRGSGLRQIVLNDYNAQCAPDAFAGTHPVFLTRGGSGVDAFACRNGFTVFWFPD